MTRCPDEAELLHFVDGALPVEDTERVRIHAAQCTRCGAGVDALRTLLGDLAAADVPPFDAQDHARAVRERIDRVERASQRRGPSGTQALDPQGRSRLASTRAFAWAGAGFAAVAAMFVAVLGLRSPAGSWQARGGVDPSRGANVEAGGQASALRRDVGVRIFAAAPALDPLAEGARISPETPLTAGFRNLGRSTAFLLLFAVDERHKVHWLSPAFTRREDDPPSTALEAGREERVLPTTVVLEDVPMGALRLVAVITMAPARVSDIEALEGTDVSAERIERAIPGAEVRETRVQVAALEANPRHP